MTQEMKIAIIMADGCTEYDAERHAKNSCIWENPEEYIEDLKINDIWDGETLDDFRNRKSGDVKMVTYEGHEYLIQYAL